MATGSGNHATLELQEEANIIRKGTSDGLPTIFKIPLTKGKNHQGSEYKVYCFGKEEIITKGHRVIMVVGSTGSGKSTLINAMVNYILQVKWKDKFRFKIISDKEEGSTSQAESQTQTLVCYTIYPSPDLKLDYTLTIIDTPGFGDTRGLEQDKLITDKIREFFTNCAGHHIDHIDAIGFVAQASLARLTPNQKYVFDSVLSIFGKDIKNNIMMLATFADGQDPAIKDAIKEAEIPCTEKIYKFNNSALFAKIGSDFSFDSLFWDMAMKSLGEFFASLEKLEPKSISLTAEVLNKRKQLELTLTGLQDQMRVGFYKIEELKAEEKILEDYKADVEKHKGHTYKVKRVKIRKIKLDQRDAMNCTYCMYTCHQPCMSFDTTRGLCKIFSWKGNCTVCPDRCSMDTHFVQAFKHEIYTDEEEKTYRDIEKKFQEATKKKMTHEDIVKQHKQELLQVELRVAQLIGESRSILGRLKEIALSPDPLNAVDYIDLLIQTEKREARPEWQSRVKALHEIRDNANLLNVVQHDKPIEAEQEKTTEEERGSNWALIGWLSRKWDKFKPIGVPF